MNKSLIGFKRSGNPGKLPPRGDKTLERQLGTMTVKYVAELYDCERQAIYARYNSAELEALRRRYGKLRK